jgi:GNAT superfamily N-acetyltransferase
MPRPLDRVVWNALNGPHAKFAEGGALARRYRPDIIPFAAARDSSAESLAALAALPKPGEVMVMWDAEEPPLPPGLVSARTGNLVQMILAREPEAMDDARIEALTEADAEEMLALARLTEPGPFTLKAQALGTFYGIRMDGKLAAMTGERMKPEGFGEVSGVCTHPDFRGRGLARVLSVFVARKILARGETPFLPAWTENAAAIRLYEQIGFAVRNSSCSRRSSRSSSQRLPFLPAWLPGRPPMERGRGRSSGASGTISCALPSSRSGLCGRERGSGTSVSVPGPM